MICLRFGHYFIWTSAFSLLTNAKCSLEIIPRTKRSIDGNFRVLLDLYKMNPLKDSDVFKMFSNKILLPIRGTRYSVLHFDANESGGEKQLRTAKNLKQIEDVIHTKPETLEVPRPYMYAVGRTAPEEFSAGNLDGKGTALVIDVEEKRLKNNIMSVEDSIETTDGIQSTFDVTDMTTSHYDLLASMENYSLEKINHDEIEVMR